MFPIAALVVLSPAGPLPGGKPIDYVVYAFADPDRYARSVSLRIDRGGRVAYSYRVSQPIGYMPPDVKKEWTIPAAEARALIGHLVAAGLLDMPDGKGRGATQFAVGVGNWSLLVSPETVPELVTARLRPLLATAHPERWGEKAVAPQPAADARPAVARLRYTLATAPMGQAVTLEVARDGTVSYRRDPIPPVVKATVLKEWKLPAADAAAVLDALAADGLFDLPAAADAAQYPNHQVVAHAGRWRLSFHPKELPEKVSKHLRPLMQKADAEFWK